MYVRLAFSVAVHVDPDILLVDEVLAVGDEPFQRKCMDRIRGFQQEGRTIVLVSHALDQVADLCDRAVVLEQGTVRADGPPRDALRVLRNDFEETRRRDIERSAAVGDKPSVRIASVELATRGVPTERLTMRPGDDLKVIVSIASDRRVDTWNVGIALRTPGNHRVLATDAVMMGGPPLQPFEGPVTVQFTLPRVMLGEGDYVVSAAISLDGRTKADSVSEAAHLVVASTGRYVGSTHVEPVITVL